MNTIVVGGQEFYDISAIVGPDRYHRSRTVALVIHHTVGPSSFASMEDELAHIRAIDAQHRANGWGGFGYQGIVFPSGRVYVVGRGHGARAHVADRNHELEGLAMAGDFSTAAPPLGIILGAGRWVFAKFKQRGFLSVMGHRQAALASDPTACPGDGGMRALPAILSVAAALGRRERLEDVLRRALYLVRAGRALSELPSADRDFLRGEL